ncbi:MAG: hypothetical protein LBT91_02970 [Bifidobacteriaceae bacterium]|jgi:hypothetical protein|nr:hypothetical protein [Bifidobacteriaceae bacterium]
MNNKIYKLGIGGLAFTLILISFTAGSFLDLNSVNAASSATVLPISRGGTNSSTASGAAANILGTNFANYSAGALPIANGGTGTDSGNHRTMAYNLGMNPGIKIDYNGAWTSTPYWVKIFDVVRTTSDYSDYTNQSMRITGLTDIYSTRDIKDYYFLVMSPHRLEPNYNFAQYTNLLGQHKDCDNSETVAMWTTDVISSTQYRWRLYIKREENGAPGHIEWLTDERNIGLVTPGIIGLQLEYFDSTPTGDYTGNLKLRCVKYTEK